MDDKNNNSDNVINNNAASNVKVGDTVKKKNINVLAILFGITTLLSASVAIFFGVKYFMVEKRDTETGSCPEIKCESEEENENTNISEKMGEEYLEVRKLMEEISSDLARDLHYYEVSSNVMAKSDWSEAYIPTRYAISDVSIRGKDVDDSVYETLKTKLLQAGFKELGRVPVLGSAGPHIDGFYNFSLDITCNSYADIMAGSYDSMISFECAKNDWVWLTDEERRLIEGLEDAYYKKTGDYPSLIDTRDGISVEDSQVSPYQKLGIGFGGAYASFYRLDSNSEWQFFGVSQDGYTCDKYNTDDLRKAFAGDVCYNGREESTVQP